MHFAELISPIFIRFTWFIYSYSSWLYHWHRDNHKISPVSVNSLWWIWVKLTFLHDWPWISPRIKSISNQLDIIIHVIASIVMSSAEEKLSKWAMRTMCKDHHFYRHLWIFLCHVRNKIMYVLSWWALSPLTWVLFWCLFPSLLPEFISLVASQLRK